VKTRTAEESAMTRMLWMLPVVALLAACGSNAPTTNQTGGAAITGAGSTFVYPVLSAWSADYAAQNGIKVNYQSIGSGGGVSQVKARTVDFGATDQPLAPAELAQSRLAQFPIVIGGIVPVVNLPGFEAGKLRLTGPVLADIFAGKIKKWNDAAIVQTNPGTLMPDASITVVHRSDGSGTTYNFTHYLSQVSPAWKSGPGEGKTVAWPAGVGGKGNEGVAGYVKQIPNSIGYVEYAYALQGGLAFAALQNAAGNFVSPSSETFSNAAASADWPNAKDFDLVMTNAPGATAYPITATTFILMPTSPSNKARSKAALDFFRFALEHGQARATKLDYVPLPPALVQQIETYVGQKIK
jgi:phosphate transport system substrate-binding protein